MGRRRGASLGTAGRRRDGRRSLRRRRTPETRNSTNSPLGPSIFASLGFLAPAASLPMIFWLDRADGVLFNELKLTRDFVPWGSQTSFSAEKLGSRRCALQARLPRGSGAATACPRVGKWEHLPTAPERQGRMGVRRARPRSPPSGRRTPRRVIQMQREGNQAEIPPQKNWLRPTAGP